MKRITIIIIASLMLTSCARDFVKTGKNKIIEKFPQLVKQEYVPGIEDMPIYYGFEEKTGSAISYDTTNGRIINAEYYSKTADIENVRLFYKTTLPQLGWYMRKPKIYVRDGETLQLDIGNNNGSSSIKFSIRPSIS